MASLRRIADAKGKPWEIRWRDPRTGKQPRRRYATRELADRAFQEALRIEGLDPLTPLERNATVAELIDLEESNSSRTDNQTRRSYISNHVPDAFLVRVARNVVIEDIEALLAEAAKKLSRESVKKLRNILSSVFNFGSKRRYCATNPVSGARIPARCQISQRARKMVDDEVDPDEIPSPGEVASIAKAVDDRFNALVLSLGYLGFRLGEASGLDVRDWNRTLRVLRIRRSSPETAETKGHRTFRDVDVSPSLAMVIANQLGHTNAAFTRRVYAGVWRRIERQVSSKMDRAIADQLAS